MSAENLQFGADRLLEKDPKVEAILEHVGLFRDRFDDFGANTSSQKIPARELPLALLKAAKDLYPEAISTHRSLMMKALVEYGRRSAQRSKDSMDRMYEADQRAEEFVRRAEDLSANNGGPGRVMTSDPQITTTTIGADIIDLVPSADDPSTFEAA